MNVAAPVLRVMTWNRWWRFGDWQRRYESIIQVLQSSAPDIVGLQEVWATSTANQAQLLAETLGMHVAWCPSPAPEHFQRRLGDRSVVVGNAILSRWPITRISTCVLPAGAGDAGRTALFALTATPAGPVPCLTTQLTSTRAVRAPVRPGARARPVRRRRKPEGANPLLTGDFNAEPDSDEIRLLGGHKTPPAVPGLVLLDAWRYADREANGWTWDRRNPAVLATGEPDARIDYVFLGYRGNSESAPRVRSAALAGNEPIDGVWPSDHAAVVVELEMAGDVLTR